MAYNPPPARYEAQEVPKTMRDRINEELGKDVPRQTGMLESLSERIYELCGSANICRGSLADVVSRVLGPCVANDGKPVEAAMPASAIGSLHMALDQLDSEIRALHEHAKRLQQL
jgi:hypothetical protein